MELVPVDYDPFGAASQAMAPAVNALFSKGIAGAMGMPSALEQIAAGNAQQQPLIAAGQYGKAALTGLDNPALFALGAGPLGRNPLTAGANEGLLRDTGEVNIKPNALAAGDAMPIKAYHGSPYDFDAFDMSKIGTGEGAQAYGHGLYFAESPGVAQSYKDQLAGKSTAQIYIDGKPIDLGSATPAQVLAASVSASANPLQELASVKPIGNYTQDAIKEAQRIISENKVEFKPPGRMYEVNLHADPDTFLHWDKPLSEQPEAVRNIISKLGDTPMTLGELEGNRQTTLAERLKELNPDALPGGDLYRALAKSYGSKPTLGKTEIEAVEQLRNAGISGIKYLDQNSRKVDNSQFIKQLQQEIDQQSTALPNDLVQRSIDGKKQSIQRLIEEQKVSNPTHNYVVFSPEMIEIVKKYGLAGLIAGGANAISGNADAATHLVPVEHDPFAQ